MPKLICQVCHSVVDEEACYHFSQCWNDDLKATEHFAGLRCPECGADGEYLTETSECIDCHEDKDPADLIGGLICRTCYEWEVRNHPSWVLEYLADQKEEFAEFLAEKM